ncbi:MAG TPA: nucleoside hydrolase [Candidatus Limnocylindrales bacterium]|nr:nucleoside hydrolase [Candidatus Limnocylindrales bacterium]
MTERLILDHDGGVDDYLALLLCLTFERATLEGVVVTPADCYIEPAVEASRKIVDLAGRSSVPVARSTVRGLNPFPREYRRDSFSIDMFPILNESGAISAPRPTEPGQRWLANVLATRAEAGEPVTLLVTGPLTTVAEAIDLEPRAIPAIRRIVWMGGALRVPGNVSPHEEAGQDGSMEWNVYWDPLAAARVFATSIPIVMCPLDLTNRVPMTRDFLLRLGRQRRYPFSDFAGQCYALVAFKPYYFWDVLTAAYVERPELFGVTHDSVTIVTDGPSQGRTVPAPRGRPVEVLANVDVDGFYEFVLRRWQR